MFLNPCFFTGNRATHMDERGLLLVRVDQKLFFFMCVCFVLPCKKQGFRAPNANTHELKNAFMELWGEKKNYCFFHVCVFCFPCKKNKGTGPNTQTHMKNTFVFQFAGVCVFDMFPCFLHGKRNTHTWKTTSFSVLLDPNDDSRFFVFVCFVFHCKNMEPGH